MSNRKSHVKNLLKVRKIIIFLINERNRKKETNTKMNKIN